MADELDERTVYALNIPDSELTVAELCLRRYLRSLGKLGDGEESAT
ncbi:hypothetical protein KIH74_34375 [Kineosporia sp. J2-2]|uniref:Uncharacterized protein n=1 Tax=Kineosporia corallincola TaxID=2835133 RepID=A0ABS5TTG8_9ACTN|nr:hypothetical protein [Kineosporia corallincola]MBT0774083.1 hypothetical protein [Kineosporia corallincola]